MQRQQTLWVINRNADQDAHEDRFDGEDYYFPADVPVEIPVEGANLMFGYGVDDKTSTLMRCGKVQTAKDMKTGLVWLSNIAFYGTEQEANAANAPVASTERQFAPALENAPAASPGASGAVDQKGKIPPKIAEKA